MRRDPDPRPSGSGGAGGPADAGLIRAHLWASGVVQGVGFRFFVQRRAVMLGVRGFVRNLRDGRVEVAAEGPAGAVHALVDAVRDGPSGADVGNVQVIWEAPLGDAAFVIRADGRA